MDVNITPEFLDTLRRYQATYHRAISLHDVLNKAMALWVSFIIHHTIQSDPTAIRAQLMASASTSGTNAKRSKAFGPQVHSSRYTAGKQLRRIPKLKGRALERQNAYKNTLAAAIAYARNYKGIRRASPSQAYALIERFIKRRTNSVGYHKYSYLPALRRLKGFSTTTGLTSQFSGPGRFLAHSPPGMITPATDTDPIVEVTAWARAIVEVNGAAPDVTLPQVQAQLEKYIAANLETAHQAFK